MNHILLAASVTAWADGAPRNHGPDFGKASPLGLLVIVLLLIATLLLMRSMSRQLKKVPASFDPEHPAPDPAPDEGTGPAPAPDEGAGPDPAPDEGTDGAKPTEGSGDEPR